MTSETPLELRVAAIETGLAELRDQIESRPDAMSWLDRVAGSITDEAAFEEALSYGRAFRQADRPADEDEPAKRGVPRP